LLGIFKKKGTVAELQKQFDIDTKDLRGMLQNDLKYIQDETAKLESAMGALPAEGQIDFSKLDPSHLSVILKRLQAIHQNLLSVDRDVQSESNDNPAESTLIAEMEELIGNIGAVLKQ
jgi:hypothetical protein